MNATVTADQEGLLTAEEFARLARLSVKSVRRLCAEGKLIGIKVGSCWRLPADQIEKALEAAKAR